VTPAAEGARRDGEVWSRMLALAEVILPDAREVDVTGFDPLDDLTRRGRWWSYRPHDATLPTVLAFGVALAEAECAAWKRDDPVVATRAFEDRRFLFGDRLIHWVVPLTYAGSDARELRETLLVVGDRLRPAPILTGDEGLHPPGEDSFGPAPLTVRLGSPQRWELLAAAHPGTARLWRDLARRAGDAGR
jgi:hypothetical protein